MRVSLRFKSLSTWGTDSDETNAIRIAFNQPSEVEVQLYANGVAEGSAAVLKAGNMWEYTWSGLASSVEWTVREITPLPNGYVSTVTGDQINGYTITNTYIPILCQIRP